RVGHHLAHPGVDRAQGFHGEQAAGDAGLVGGHHHAPAGLAEPADGLRAAGDRHPFVRRLDERVAVVVDDPVAVQDDEFHRASLDRSATWFISPCRDRSRARRLARTRASSAMTMTSVKKASTAVRAWARVARLAVKSPAFSCAVAWGSRRAMVSASWRSAGSVSSDGSKPGWVSSAFFSRLRTRLLAAARGSASGCVANRSQAWTLTATWCSGGRRASTASMAE